jgi:hypothetical protein
MWDQMHTKSTSLDYLSEVKFMGQGVGLLGPPLVFHHLIQLFH